MSKNTSAYDQTQFIKVDATTDVYKLANKLMKGVPLILNFETNDILESNRMIIFLSGVIYALDGNVEIIREKILAFGTKDDLKDKRLRKFIDEHKA